MEFDFDTDFGLEHWTFVRQHWKIGFICSTFDLLHAGHILMIKDAKSVCDYLVAGLQVDPSRDRFKNPPIQSYEERYEQLSAVKYILDIIKYETDDELLMLLTGLKPEIRILGSDWRDREDEIIGKDISPIYWHDRSIHKYSTTSLRDRIYRAARVKRLLEDSV